MIGRSITTGSIKQAVVNAIHECSFSLPQEILALFNDLLMNETNELARETMRVIIENNTIAQKEQLPLCQDCGMVIVFLEIGQEVTITGGNLYEDINVGVREAYHTCYLRKSIVGDPLKRINSGDNTPSFIHADIVPGDTVRLTVYLKGGGSENMSVLRMFKPTASMDEIIDYITDAVAEAGPNPCPPLFLGIGIGGTADMAMLNAKKAVLRGIRTSHEDPFYRDLELRIYEKVNATNVGPLGFGGKSTVAGVYIKEAPTHIATLPVALNMNCHSMRFSSRIL